NLLMALGVFFGGYAVVDYFWGKRILRRLTISRKAPDAVFAGETFAVEIEVKNRSKRAVWAVAVEDVWEPESKTPKFLKITKDADKADDAPKSNPLGPTAYFAKIDGGATQTRRYYGVLPRRGLRKLTSLTATTRFPMGFFRSEFHVDVPDEILVFPKIGTLTDAWRAFAGIEEQDAGAPTARASRAPDETLTVRDWRPGDPKKAIHWRATAKRERLQVRDFEERKAQTVFVALDLQIPEEPSAPATDAERVEREFRRWENVELAVSFAATLVEHFTRLGDGRFFFAVNDAEAAEATELWRGGTGALETREIFARLATAQPPKSDALGRIFEAADPRTLGEALVFIISVAPFDLERISLINVGVGATDAIRFIDVSSSDFLDYFDI
ncbi:MAG: DUF58 domain-containing protein, partial [Thermoguttaceae bacterium]|nr:DUF58 domain-containing protein [Thermoguttaceae bacterium]